LEGVFNHPDLVIRKLMEAIFRAFPMARMAVYLSVGVYVVAAVAECVLSGRCIQHSRHNKRECDGFPEDGPYWMLDGLAVSGRFTWTDFDENGRLRVFFRSTAGIRAGRPYKDWQKAMVYGANLLRNNGILRDDVTGNRLAPARAARHAGKGGMKGTASVDHRCPQDLGGSNSFGNACVVEFNSNSSKRTTIPPVDYCTWWSVLRFR
jgi:hypothetical protein